MPAMRPRRNTGHVYTKTRPPALPPRDYRDDYMAEGKYLWMSTTILSLQLLQLSFERITQEVSSIYYRQQQQQKKQLLNLAGGNMSA